MKIFRISVRGGAIRYRIDAVRARSWRAAVRLVAKTLPKSGTYVLAII